jgi:hypothetical protein
MNIKELSIGLTLSLVLSVGVNVNAYGSKASEKLAKTYCDGLTTSVRRSENFDDEKYYRRALKTIKQAAIENPEIRSKLYNCIQLTKPPVLVSDDVVIDKSLWLFVEERDINVEEKRLYLYESQFHNNPKIMDNKNKSCKSALIKGSQDAFCIGRYGYRSFCYAMKESEGSNTPSMAQMGLDEMFSSYPTFKHLYKNGGYKEHKVSWDETGLGTCTLSMRVQGVYKGSTINKFFEMSINRFYVKEGYDLMMVD